MSLREQIQKRLDSKRAEIASMELRLASERSYAQALEDMLKIVAREASEESTPAGPTMLRPGTAMAHAQKAIVDAGKPLHISDILKAIGKEDTKENRVSLAGSLGTYARQRKIFTRPGPNVFGVIDAEVSDNLGEQKGPFEVKVA